MIEDVQKVNKLAQELLNQGIAASRDEAVQKAQEFLNKTITKERAAAQDTSKVIQETDMEILRNMIERQREMTQRQLNDFKSAINALAEEIQKIKEQLKTKKETVTAKESGLDPEHKTGQIELERPKQEKKSEPHPKRGEWKSEDVAVEKIFYYGKK